MVVGGGIGAYVARTVEMTKMPELVAAMHSLIGLAAVCIATAAVAEPSAFGITVAGDNVLPLGNRVELCIGTFVGAITFSGSVIAFGKLSGKYKFRLFQGAPVQFAGQHMLNLLLAVAMLGAPLALSLGVPLGTWLGGLLGWRWAFGLLSLIALLLVGWVLHSVPDFPGQPAGRRLRLLGVLRTPGVRPVLLVIVAWVLAHNILYTYIAPFLAKVGLGASVDLALLVFGSAAVVGIWLVGALVDRHLRRMVLASLALFAVAALALCLGARWSWLAFAGLALWGLTFGGAATLLQTASADAAGEGADLAQSMIVVAWNLAIAGGGALGGMVLQRWGSEMLPWTLLPLIGLAAALAWGNAAHAFRVGPRGFPRASSERRKAAE
ncbi:NAD(P)(+) transhydrogenase (Re/Si-specific) subunit beta [Pseudomonas aeruginosa]|nr:NAD(P)(+) transhydrogenase (Re/Si-specific) subunit beta [Pseudomonas aeruginosa]